MNGNEKRAGISGALLRDRDDKKTSGYGCLHHTTPQAEMSTPAARRARLEELSELIDRDDENYGDYYAEWIRLWPVVFADLMLPTIPDKPTSYRDDPVIQMALARGSSEPWPGEDEPKKDVSIINSDNAYIPPDWRVTIPLRDSALYRTWLERGDPEPWPEESTRNDSELEAEAKERLKGGQGGILLSQTFEQANDGKSTQQAATILGTNRQYVSDAKKSTQKIEYVKGDEQPLGNSLPNGEADDIPFSGEPMHGTDDWDIGLEGR